MWLYYKSLFQRDSFWKKALKIWKSMLQYLKQKIQWEVQKDEAYKDIEYADPAEYG